MYTIGNPVHFWTSNRPVVTGLGIVAPNGKNLLDFWNTLLAGKSAVRRITRFDAKEFSCRIAGEIRDFDAAQWINDEQKPHRLARFAQLAIAATRMACEDAGLDKPALHTGKPLPLYMGVSTSAIDVIETQHDRLRQQEQEPGRARVSAFGVPMSFPQSAAQAVARALGVDMQLMTLSSGCASGLDAIAAAAESVRSGRTDLAVAGGSDTPVTPLCLAGFSAARLLSTCNRTPGRASRPFDLERDGGVIAEGAAMIVIENRERALARGAQPYAVIAGSGSAMDHTDQDLCSGLHNAMQRALDNGACRPECIEYISAHAPSDPMLDRIETTCIRSVFGPRADHIPVSSIKGVTGNPLAAAGPMQTVAGAMTMRQGILPPTANCTRPDPDCHLHHVVGEPREAHPACLMINTHGLGGNNTSLILEQVET